MTENLIWRPLGINSEEEIATYDALHDGVPPWIETAFWRWVRSSISRTRLDIYGSRIEALDEEFFESMCTVLKIPVSNIRQKHLNDAVATNQLSVAVSALRGHNSPLQIADYVLAHNGSALSEKLSSVLDLGKSAWQVGARSGRTGLVRRVPTGVQEVVDSIIVRSEIAGKRLAKAWESVYGVSPNPSEAYALAIKAIEDVAIPVVSPKNAIATLGTVIRDIKGQKVWDLPLKQQKESAPSGEVLVSMMQLVWNGQHDRHGGQISAPEEVSLKEATVAVTMAFTLVSLFSAGLVSQQMPEC